MKPYARIVRLSRLWYSVHLELPGTSTAHPYATAPYVVPTLRWAQNKARRLLRRYEA